MISRRSIALASLMVAAAPTGIAAQDPAPLTLGSPDATLSEPFSLLRGLRELPDGRLLVTDWIEERLVLVDLAAGTLRDHGRVGAGPGEFRLPATLLPFRADSTLLVDVGNARLHVLDGQGRIARTFQPPTPAAASPLAADESGRIYFIIPAWMARPPLPGDTVEVASWMPGESTTRAVMRMHGSTQPPTNFSAGPRIPFVVFARQDAAAVTRDGRVARVRGGDYSVEWRRDGQATAGPAYGGRPVPATNRERMAYGRRFLQSAPMSGRGEGGGLGHTPADAQTERAVAEMVRHTTWAETLPFFRPSDVRVDPRGRLWVGRWLPDGQPDLHDVFDGTGTRIASIALPAGRRLLGVGRDALYLVREDETGLQTLERYAVPAPLTAR